MKAAHKKRFDQERARLPASVRNELNWLAVLHVVTSDPDLWNAAAPHIYNAHAGRTPFPYAPVGSYAWDRLENEVTTDRHFWLARLSGALFYDSYGNISLEYLWNQFDKETFDLAVEAIRIRRGDLKIEPIVTLEQGAIMPDDQ